MWVMPSSILYTRNLFFSFIMNLMEEDGIGLIVKKYVNWPTLEYRAQLHL
jgi:hypothetical protein